MSDCEKYKDLWQRNIDQDIATPSGQLINFIKCSMHGIDEVTGLKYVLLKPGLYLYHGSPGIADMIKDDHLDPKYPLGKDSQMEETWYGPYSIATLYAPKDKILVFRVFKEAKMLLLNDYDNLMQLLNNAANMFPGKTTQEQDDIKDQFRKFLHQYTWVNTGKGGKLYPFAQYGYSKFEEQPINISNLQNLHKNGQLMDRYGSRFVEQRMAGFLCGWLHRYGFAGYLSDKTHTTDPRLGFPKNTKFHGEVVFCYAPDYLERVTGDPLDAQSHHVQLDLMDIEFRATKKDYINFYNSIKNNPNIDDMFKEKWKAVIAGLRMPTAAFRRDGKLGFIPLCQVDGRMVDIYAFILKNNAKIRKILGRKSIYFPTNEELANELNDTLDIIGTFDKYCDIVKQYNLVQLVSQYKVSGKKFPERLGLYKMLQKSSQQRQCAVSKILEDIHVIPVDVKKSSSPTMIIYGKYKCPPGLCKNAKLDVVLKVSFSLLPSASDNSLDIERCIYERIINRLILTKYTPNIMAYVDTYTCPTREFINDSVEVGHYLENLWNMLVSKGFSKSFDVNNVSLLILEKGNGDSMYNTMTQGTVGEWKSVLFQIFYTLAIFNYVGLRHNDLHPGNVFIETGTATQDQQEQNYINYWIDNDTYFHVPLFDAQKWYDKPNAAIPTFMPKIFDFDLGVYPECPKNRRLDSTFSDKGISTNPHPKWDTFYFAVNVIGAFLQKSSRDTQEYLSKVLNTILPSGMNILEGKHRRGKLCIEQDGTCIQDYIPPDDQVLSPAQIVTSGLFDEFKKHGPYTPGLCNFRGF